MSFQANTSSFTVAIVVVLCLLTSAASVTVQKDVSVNSPVLDFESLEAEITRSSNVEVQNDIGLQDAACDCGPNSKGCKIENGTKVCECEYHYRQENGLCKDWCNDLWYCENGGTCVNESCECLPGTFGGFCKEVEACEGIKGPLLCGDPDKVTCEFDAKTLEPYCTCRTYDYLYVPELRGCKECDCGKLGSCSLVDGKKTCKCNEGTALRDVGNWGVVDEKCVVCDCGNNSNGCSFNGYEKVCDCKKGFAQQPDLYGDACNECSCGPHGECYFRGWYQYCECDEGYKPFLTLNRTDLFCKECDCGKNGVCSFEKEVKQCKCNPGYELNDGICTACQCYLGNETAPCTFTNKIQKCICPDGYKATKFFCEDIDECLNSSNSCPSDTTDCLNTMGSYECVCKEGYEPRRPGSDPKEDGCYDIDECEDEALCPRNHTICRNLIGSYSCTCQQGYVVVPPNISPKDAGCEKEKVVESSPWKTGLIILGVVLGICIIGTVTAIFIRHRSKNRSPLRTESAIHYRR